MLMWHSSHRFGGCGMRLSGWIQWWLVQWVTHREVLVPKTEPRETYKRFLKNMSNIISWEENTWPKPRSLQCFFPPSGNQKAILAHDQMVKNILIFQFGTRIYFHIKSNYLGGHLHLVPPPPRHFLSSCFFPCDFAVLPTEQTDLFSSIG